MGCCFSASSGSISESTLQVELAHVQMDDVVPFSQQFAGKTFECRVLDVYDGDTCTVVFNATGACYTKIVVRLLGIDTAEMTGKSHKNDALDARNTLVYHLTGCKVTRDMTRKECREVCAKSTICTTITCDKLDKYGRLLATIHSVITPSKTVNQILLDEKLAKPYFGGKKEQSN